MATKPPLPPPAAAAALPHTALPPSPQPRGCPPRPFPRIPVAATPLCAAHTPSQTATFPPSFRHDDFSLAGTMQPPSSPPWLSKTPPMCLWCNRVCGRRQGSCRCLLPQQIAIDEGDCIDGGFVDALSSVEWLFFSGQTALSPKEYKQQSTFELGPREWREWCLFRGFNERTWEVSFFILVSVLMAMDQPMPHSRLPFSDKLVK